MTMPPLLNLAPRPTTYKGIPMRSRLEAKFARFLDHLGATWTYEPRAYAGSTGDYLPDFEVAFEEDAKHPTFIEVKPVLEYAEAAMERMEVIWESVPDAVLCVVLADPPFILHTTPKRRWEQDHLQEWADFR